jgi:hypothetical protein
VRAITFAITPPLVRTPHASPPYSQRSQSQRITSSSTNGAAIPESHTSMPWFSHCARVSPAMDIGRGGGVK